MVEEIAWDRLLTATSSLDPNIKESAVSSPSAGGHTSHSSESSDRPCRGGEEAGGGSGVSVMSGSSGSPATRHVAVLVDNSSA